MERRGEHRELLKRGQQVAIAATIIIFFLAFAKFVIGYLFESRILIADAYHSGVDVFAIFTSWFGLQLTSRKKNTNFPSCRGKSHYGLEDDQRRLFCIH